MIKTQSTGLRITLTASDFKTGINNGMRSQLEDFIISEQDLDNADLIEFVQTSTDNKPLGRKILKNRLDVHNVFERS